MPVNLLIVRALINLYTFYGDEFKVECPTGSGRHATLFEVAREIVDRLTAHSCAMPMGSGRSTAGRPSSRTIRIGATDPLLRVLPRRQRCGLGASHQTGWTGLVAPLLDMFGRVDAKDLLETERGT
jgi:hypothetical protein